MQSHCPEVLTFQVPRDPEQAGRFLSHLWIFDHLKVTAEGQQRNLAYKQSSERASFHKASLSFSDFLAGLDLTIEIAPLVPRQIPRVAELTQRTNQFNFTTQRRSESEIQQPLSRRRRGVSHRKPERPVWRLWPRWRDNF